MHFLSLSPFFHAFNRLFRFSSLHYMMMTFIITSWLTFSISLLWVIRTQSVPCCKSSYIKLLIAQIQTEEEEHNDEKENFWKSIYSNAIRKLIVIFYLWCNTFKEERGNYFVKLQLNYFTWEHLYFHLRRCDTTFTSVFSLSHHQGIFTSSYLKHFSLMVVVFYNYIAYYKNIGVFI